MWTFYLNATAKGKKNHNLVLVWWLLCLLGRMKWLELTSYPRHYFTTLVQAQEHYWPHVGHSLVSMIEAFCCLIKTVCGRWFKRKYYSHTGNVLSTSAAPHSNRLLFHLNSASWAWFIMTIKEFNILNKSIFMQNIVNFVKEWYLKIQFLHIHFWCGRII